jgi:hypothetical protein
MLVDSGSSVLISVARQSSALGNWYNYTFTTVSGFADYPQLGVDDNGIYFGVNMYNRIAATITSCSTPTARRWKTARPPNTGTGIT